MLADAVGRFLGFMAISGPGWILLTPAGPPAGATLGAFTILSRTPCGHTNWLRKRRTPAGLLIYPLFPSRTKVIVLLSEEPRDFHERASFLVDYLVGALRARRTFMVARAG